MHEMHGENATTPQYPERGKLKCLLFSTGFTRWLLILKHFVLWAYLNNIIFGRKP